jgi:hypothetical protein
MKLIFIKLTVALSASLLIIDLAQAANVDFKSIYNSDLESCNNIQTDKDNTNSKDGVASFGAIENRQCESVKTDKDYVEPKFSTKRPRGQ